MKMPSRTTLIRSGITVAVLVVAIVAGSLFAASKRPPVPATIQLNAQQQSKADYDNALSALSNEATSTAIMLLERAVTIDPANTAARTKLAELKKSSAEPKPSTPPPNPTTPTTTAPEPPKPDPNKPDPFCGRHRAQEAPAVGDGRVLAWGRRRSSLPTRHLRGSPTPPTRAPSASSGQFTTVMPGAQRRSSSTA